jgi:hypothetical protein
VIWILRQYLKQGRYSKKMKKYKGIGVGFADGDLEVLFSR